MEINYGRKIINKQMIGYATFTQDGNKYELLNLNEGLHTRINGKEIYKPGDKNYPYWIIMLWTKIAGWMGSEDLMRSFS